MTPDELARLSYRVEQFINLETGRTMPYVGLLFDPTAKEQGLALFTNRKSNDEVRLLLEDALAALNKTGTQFKIMDGEIQSPRPKSS